MSIKIECDCREPSRSLPMRGRRRGPAPLQPPARLHAAVAREVESKSRRLTSTTVAFYGFTSIWRQRISASGGASWLWVRSTTEYWAGVLSWLSCSGVKPPGSACCPPARRDRRQAGNGLRCQANGTARRERRPARYDEMARRRREGVPIRRIARRLGMARNAVRRWLRAGAAPVYRRAPGSSALDRHRAYGERRWAEGCRNSAQLWRELRDRGFAAGTTSSGGGPSGAAASPPPATENARCRRGACRRADAPRAF